MPSESTRVTLVQVAAAAGVSLSTASLAFGEGKPISPGTRAKVLAAAGRLGYQGPDPRGRSLRSGRTGIIGVQVDAHVARAFRDPVVIGILEGITDALADTTTAVLLLPDTLDDAGLHAAPVDGVVAAGCSPHLQRLRDVMGRRSVPVVTAGNQVDDQGCVGIENAAATVQLARHLHGLGHRRIAIVALPPSQVGDARVAGACEVFPDAEIVCATDSTIDAGWAATRDLLERGTLRADGGGATAVIAQSDLLAAGVIRAAEAAGLHVPRDLSVTGFDGIAIDGFDSHRLTTIRQHITEQGRRAAEAVLATLDEGAPLPRITVPVELVLGDTTGPAT
ncbi:LacI family DNA-binding transcriptional regulator [Tsukamurella soli]|uniref:LacI family DNA-binding transcriptional regulator n=1 Tax=Tsukamurella soli TaxID=644556 RepID=UPI0031EB77FD